MSGLAWSIILLIVALAVISLEMFIPSAGLLGFLAATMIISSIIVAFFHSVSAGIAMIVAVVLVLPLMFIVFINVWPHTPIGRRVLLKTNTEDDVRLKGDYYDQQQSLVGKIGVARSKMIPSGQIVIDGQKYDAISDGFPIEAGETVKVVAVRMFKIFVRKVDPDQAPVKSSSLEDDDILSQPIDDVFEE